MEICPSGARVYRQHYDGENTTAVKYIVDPVGAYPTVLMELDAQTLIPQHWFVHANGQTLAQCDLVPPSSRDRFFLLHDRLGSVRLAVDESGAVKATFTYDPFGNSLENQVAAGFDTPYRFANYWWDEVVGQYYCNARWYAPELARFTGRDLAEGNYADPLTLHPYLYCWNDAINYTDPSGLYATQSMMDAVENYALGLEIATIGLATDNDFMFTVGDFILRLTPLVYAVSLATAGVVGDVDDLFKPSNQSQVRKAGKSIENYLGKDLTIKRSDAKGFVAMSKDGKRRFRLDFGGHGDKPHGHIEVYDPEKGRFVDAGPEHRLYFRE